MWFSPNDTLYFDSLDSLEDFSKLGTQCTRPLALDNSNIKSVAIGGFGRYDTVSGSLIISNDYSGRGLTRYDNVGRRLSRLRNLESLVLLIKDSLPPVETSGSLLSSNYSKIQTFQSGFTDVILRHAPDRNQVVSPKEEHETSDGSSMPVTLPEVEAISVPGAELATEKATELVTLPTWWENPSVTILGKSAYLGSMNTTDSSTGKLHISYPSDIRYLMLNLNRWPRPNARTLSDETRGSPMAVSSQIKH